jgi:uncharacterized membrane protein HdeD (DUF308 family)
VHRINLFYLYPTLHLLDLPFTNAKTKNDLKQSTLFRNWWITLIQGVVLIALSIVIFKNPEALLATMALYLGIVVIITGVVGVVAYFANKSADRNLSTLIGSGVILVIGILMITQTLITIKAITVVFGLLAAIVGVLLISGGFGGRKQWSLWWIIAVLGLCAIITGVKSIMDIYTGAQNVSVLIGTAVLIAGIGLVCLAFLKKKIIVAFNSRF